MQVKITFSHPLNGMWVSCCVRWPVYETWVLLISHNTCKSKSYTCHQFSWYMWVSHCLRRPVYETWVLLISHTTCKSKSHPFGRYISQPLCEMAGVWNMHIVNLTYQPSLWPVCEFDSHRSVGETWNSLFLQTSRPAFDVQQYPGFQIFRFQSTKFHDFISGHLKSRLL